MDLLTNLSDGFAVAFSPQNLVLVLVGVTIGMVVGTFPGLGAPTAIALLLPVTFGVDPTGAIIMLAGIYYGAQYGNTITAVLLKLPGTSSSVVTTFDGHAMARRGRAGQALTLAACASFVAGTLGTILIMAVGPYLAELALRLGPPEYFAVIVLAFATLPALGSQSRSRTMASLFLGLVLGAVGVDTFTGAQRLTLGLPSLAEGIAFVPAVIGLFGIAEVLYTGAHSGDQDVLGGEAPLRVSGYLPARRDWRRVRLPVSRGSILGFLLGILPGAGGTIASFVSYGIERSRSPYRKEFGEGAPEGVAGPEAANNAAAMGAFVPTLTLGIPGSGTMAVLMGGFLMWGVTPGPRLFSNEPELVWGLISSMYIGNAMLVVMAVLLVPVFSRVLRTPYSILAPIIVVFCVLGAFSERAAMADVWLMLVLGVLGYVMRRTSVPVAPMVLALILGPMMESNLRQAVTISQGDLSIFLRSPLAVGLLAVSAVVYLLPILLRLRGRQSEDGAPGEVSRPIDRGS